MTTKTLRLAFLLAALAIVAGAYRFILHERTPAQHADKLAHVGEAASPVRQALRSGDHAGLEAMLARAEARAATDIDGERALDRMLADLGRGSDDDLKQLAQWSAAGSHYALLALSRANRIRAFHERTEEYVHKIDPVRLNRFKQLTRLSFEQAERAAAAHPGCGMAYGQMIEALVGVSGRGEIDAVYKRAREAAPMWYAPVLGYLYAIYPAWYGKEGEFKLFIAQFAKNHPDHRAAALLQAGEYARDALVAINERKYGEAMILAELAIKHNPHNARAWDQKGSAFEGVQRAPEALQAYDKSIELYPFDAGVFRRRGLLRLRLGQPEGQDDLAQAAILGDTWSLKQAIWNWLNGNTEGVAKDWSQIPGMCQRASQAGIPDAVFCVATIRYFGYGVPQDAKQGFALMREAADRGVADAMSDVGKILWRGNAAAGVAPDKEQALRYWIRASAIGNDRALVELNQVKNDPELLRVMERIAAERRERNSQEESPELPREPQAPSRRPVTRL